MWDGSTGFAKMAAACLFWLTAPRSPSPSPWGSNAERRERPWCSGGLVPAGLPATRAVSVCPTARSRRSTGQEGKAKQFRHRPLSGEGMNQPNHRRGN